MQEPSTTTASGASDASAGGSDDSRRAERLALRAAVAVGVALALVRVVGFALDHVGSLYDDAFIYFRYADHVVEGCGLRWNCEDPPVEGFSSVLYLAMLVGARFASWDPIAASQALGVVTLVAAIGVATHAAARLGARLDARRGPFVVGLGLACVLSFDDYHLLYSVVGLETSTAALAVAAVFLAAVVEAETALGLAIAIAVLARPEAVVFAFALPLLPSRRSARSLAPLGLFLVALTLLRLAIFGDVLPNTFWAKAGGTWVHARLGVLYLAELALDHPLVVLAPLALLPSRGRPGVAFVLAASGLWLASNVRTGGDHFHYDRLLVPLVLPLDALALYGVFALARRSSGTLAEARPFLPALPVVALVLLVSARASTVHALAPGHGFPNVLRWAAVGRYLRDHERGATIATVPIGAIGYFSGLRTIDLVGLTEPRIARGRGRVPPERMIRNWIGHERHDTAWVLSQRPDLIVMTKFASTPFTELATTRAGFYAEWLLLREIKAGRIPYVLESPEVAPGVYWLMFRRVEPVR